jgi:hypothetical protein
MNEQAISMTREQEKERFFNLADRLASTCDPAEQSRLKEELARTTFGPTEWPPQS